MYPVHTLVPLHLVLVLSSRVRDRNLAGNLAIWQERSAAVVQSGQSGKVCAIYLSVHVADVYSPLLNTPGTEVGWGGGGGK